MTFLELAQRAAVECGVSSRSAIETAMPNTATATGSLGRIVNWINDSWTDIQMEHPDWDWMRSSKILGQGVSFATVAGQASYPLGTSAGTVGVLEDNFGKWDRFTFRNQVTTVGVTSEIFMDPISFDAWRDGYMYGAQQTVQTRPIAIAVGPDQSLNLGPPPNGLYTVTADYFLAAQPMVNDTDTPTGLPSRFHMLIVYLVLLKYGYYESAPEVLQRGTTEAASMMAQLEKARAPVISFGGALA